jgi:hypothetical protein
VGHGSMSLPIHAGDGVAETTLAVVRCRYRVGASRGVMSLPSHTSDDIAESVLVVV